MGMTTGNCERMRAFAGRPFERPEAGARFQIKKGRQRDGGRPWDEQKMVIV